MICAAVRAETAGQALADMEEARRAGAALCELRLDYMREAADLPRIIGGRPLPVVVTVRPRWEGGLFGGTEEERLALLGDACRLGAEYVDFESRAAGSFDPGASRLVLSFHDFEGTPGGLESLASEMRARGPFAVKIACLARGAADLARLVRLQRSLEGPCAVVAMGAHGRPLRVLYARYGGWLTYAAVRREARTAPGQLTVEDLVARYGVMSIGPRTEIYALVAGRGVPPWGADLFNEAFRAVGADARCVPIEPDDAEALSDLAGAMGLRGLWESAGGEDFPALAGERFRAWTGRGIPAEILRGYSGDRAAIPRS